MPKINLTNLQKDILRFVGKNSFGKNFYWTGGTLLSYFYFSHRNSVDLDFFSGDLFQNDQYLNFINYLKNNIKADKTTEILQLNRRIYTVTRSEEDVKLEFVFFPFPALEKKEKLEEFSIMADSLTDIMANKTLSTYQRNEPKDAYDLFYYLKHSPKYKLTELIALVEKKFGITLKFPLLLSKINALADNLDIIKPFLIIPQKNLSADVKIFFQEEFNKLAKKKIK